MHKFYIFPGNNSYLLREALLRRGNWQEETDNSNPFMECQFIWKPVNLSINEYIKLEGTSKAHPKNYVQVFNHFENIRNICTKTGLVRTLKKYYQSTYEARQANYGVFDSTPTSFLITAGVEDMEYNNFVARYRDIVKQTFNKEAVPAKHCETNMWLVKPANMNQGRGIEVFKNLNEINTFLSSRPHNSFWVVQKYVEKPLLYKSRKFDIRVWVVVTAKNEIFLYNKSYIRTSSDDYDLKADKNYVHLTNNCLQKYGENYGKHEDGNTLPFSNLEEYIQSQYPNIEFDLKKHIVTRMKDLIIDTIQCTKKALNPANRRNVFELFGYDFLIDEDLRTWLIEVNTNPYLGIPNKYIAKILPEMLDDMLEIVLDPLIPPTTKPRGDDRENGYELIYCDHGSAYSTPMSVRTQFSKNMYPIPSLIPPDFQKKLMFQQKGGDSGLHQTYVPAVKVTHKENAATSSAILHPTDGTLTKPLENPVHEVELNENKRSSSAEAKANRPQKEAKPNSIEAIHKQLSLTMIYKADPNTANIGNNIHRVLSCLTNWEIMSNKEVDLACKTLKLMAESAGNTFLSDQVNIVSLAKLLKSTNVKTDIKLAVIETINILSKDIHLKKRIICNHIVHNLISLCLASCDEKEIQNHSKAFLMATLKCLVNLGGVFNRKHFIPGETREANKIRTFFTAQGGIAAIWTIKEKSLDNEMKDYCEKSFLNCLETSDLEKQLQILDVLSTMPKTIQPPLTPKAKPEDEPNEEGGGSKKGREEYNSLLSGAIFYNTGSFWNVDKILANRGEQADVELEKFLDFPKSILKKIPIETLKQDFSEYVKEFKEGAEKREAQEKEKKQLIENEKQRKLESKKKEMEGQRKLALEHFEKRVQLNLKKQQADIERRQKELEEMKVKEAEDRKKNIEYLMTKKVERERKQTRLREQRLAKKLLENEDALNQSDIRVSKIYMPKSIQLSGNKNEYNKLNVKQLSESMLNKDIVDEKGLIEAYADEKNPTEVSHREKSRSPRGNQMHDALKISPIYAHSPSHSLLKKSHFTSPTHANGGGSSAKKGDNSLTVNNAKANQEHASMLSEFEVEGKNIEEKMNSAGSFKLPKIQKASRIMVSGKLIKSPYLAKNVLNDSILKSKMKSDPVKEFSDKENV